MKRKGKSEEQLIESRLNDLRKRFINDPTIHYKIGDRVQHGLIDYSEVIDILDDGKILFLEEKINNSRTLPEKINNSRTLPEKRKMHVAWTDIIPYVDREDWPEKLCYEEKYRFNFMQMDIGSLFTYYYHFGVDMDPDYQRGNVWNEEDEVKLIDSIFNNIEIGKFCLVFLGYDSKKTYEILDGKQRLTALVRFYENRFKYKGMYFYQMHPRDQGHFENFAISVAKTDRQLTQKEKYHYFLKLNVGGRLQDPKHIEYVKSLYEGEK